LPFFESENSFRLIGGIKMSFFDLIFFLEFELVAAPVQMAHNGGTTAMRTYVSQLAIENGRSTWFEMYCILPDFRSDEDRVERDDPALVVKYNFSGRHFVQAQKCLSFKLRRGVGVEALRHVLNVVNISWSEQLLSSAGGFPLLVPNEVNRDMYCILTKKESTQAR
jgi:hypothetical protein